MLDTGAQRQFRPAPCPQGVHNLVRDQTVYDLGAGPVSSPTSNIPRLKKAMVEAPQLRRPRGTPEKRKTEVQRLIMGDMAPREAGRTQNKLWHRLVLDQKLLHVTSSTQQPRGELRPKTTPYSYFPLPYSTFVSLYPESITFLSQTFYPQFGSSPTQAPLDFVATSRTAASLELPLGKSDTASWNEPGPSGRCADRQYARAPPFTKNLLTTGSGPTLTITYQHYPTA